MGRLLKIALIWYCGTTLCLVAAAALPNRTLSLKDSGDYVRLPSDILGPLEETTVECWVMGPISLL